MAKHGIHKRGKASYRIDYYDAEGRRHYETIRGATAEEAEAEARRQLAIRLGEKASGIPVSSKPNTVRFDELAADVVNDYIVNGHRSTADIESRFRCHILPALGKRKAASITTAQLNAYIVHRQGETPTPATGTINRELEAIRHTFKLAIKGRKLFTMPHVPHLRETNVRTGFFSRAEVDRLCACLPEPYASFVLFAFLTGWRYSEIVGLLWRNVDFVAGEIRLDAGSTKNREPRILPMSAELRELLERIPRSVSFVFQINGRPIGAFRKTWKRACHKAGLPCVVGTDGKLIKSLRVFHDLRRSAAREFQRQGFNEGQIMRMCGWKSRSVFDRYAIVTNEDIREKMKAIIGARNRASIRKTE